MENELNKAIICLGGNAPNTAGNMVSMRNLLSAIGTIERSSGEYPTAPEYAGETEPYLNEILLFTTAKSYQDTVKISMDLQADIRTKNPYHGLVAIDIDIVYWNCELLRPWDANSAYFREGMSKLGL